MSISNIRFELDGVEYIWGGGLGATLVSHEDDRKVGEMRVVNKHILKVFMITRRWFGKDRVCWCSVDDGGYDWVRKFKTELFA